MKTAEQVGGNIYRLTTPYKDIYTTVYLLRTEQGDLLFDAASYDEDIDESVLPFLNGLEVTAQSLKYVFISHPHADHAGGLKRLMQHFSDTCVVSFHCEMQEKIPCCRCLVAQEGQVFLDVLQAVSIPGHTRESGAVLDRRTGTLISGDCLQLYGIFGSGTWGAAIRFVQEHRQAVKKLRGMDVVRILTAHDYHPFGHDYDGEQIISQALDACIAPLDRIEELIRKNPDLGDEQICAKYQAEEKLPTLSAAVVAAVRKTL